MKFIYRRQFVYCYSVYGGRLTSLNIGVPAFIHHKYMCVCITRFPFILQQPRHVGLNVCGILVAQGTH